MISQRWNAGFAKTARRLLPCIIAIAILLAGGSPTHAAALRAEFNALAPRSRSQAPTLVDVKLHWQGSGLLEGVLTLTLLSEGMPLFQQRTQELALTAGSQTLRLLVPPRAVRVYTPMTEAHLRFLGKQGTIDLGTFPLSTASYGAECFLIGVCGLPAPLADGTPRLWQTLRRERFVAETATNTAKLVTSPMTMDPADLPASPLALCAFDLVLLEGDSFARLREKQLAALERWVEGGGSLCVIPGGAISGEHLGFLNRLAHTPAFAIDEQGHLVISGKRMQMLHTELGRLVVATARPEADAAAVVEWAEAAAFLWKLRPGTKPFDPGAVANPPNSANTSRRNAEAQAASNWALSNSDRQRRESIRQYLSKLLPQTTRLIPTPIVAAILGAFVLIIGPGDWFVLGWIKRRRWTWFTLPIVAVAFTALTVIAAEHYLGAEDARSRLVVIDVGRGGRVLRESRLELLFAARDKGASTDLRQCLAVPTSFGIRGYGLSGEQGNLIYEGQFPARAILRQRLRQWTPQINRLLTFETTEDRSGIQWDAIDAKDLAAKPNPARWFADRAGGSDFDCAVIHQGKSKTTAGSSHPDFPFLSALSVLPIDRERDSRPPESPSGDADLSDLPLIAFDDPSAWLVTAIKRLPNEIRIYRRIYRTDE